MSKSKLQSYNLSFAGCGFLGLYHAGVCGCIQEFAPQLYKNQKISGTSAGAIAASFLIAEANISDCIKYLTSVINNSRQYTLGAFDPRCNVTQMLIDGLEMYLPEDVHLRCSGRLHISMSNNITGQNFIATHYRDKAELIRAIICSTFIYGFSGYVPYTFRGLPMVDGGLTKNILELDENTITVSPFAGDADICPKDDWGYGQLHFLGTNFLMNWDNLSRIVGILIPRSSDGLIELARQGYDDTLKYLARKGFIKCDIHRCKTLLTKVQLDSETQSSMDNCITCRRHLQTALESTLSEQILQSFEKPAEHNTLRGYVFNKMLQLSKMSVKSIIKTVSLIHTTVSYLKSFPNFLFGTLVTPINRLIYLDNMLQEVFANALEFGHADHNRIHESLERMRHHIEFHDDFQSNKSSISGFSELVDQGIDVSNTIFDIERGEADGNSDEDLDELNIKLKSFDQSSFHHHKLTWTLPNPDDPSKLNFYSLEPSFLDSKIDLNTL